MTFSFAESIWRIFWLASATALKASLTSKKEMSAMVRPAFLSARGTANAGAMGKSMGAQAASAKAEEKMVQFSLLRRVVQRTSVEACWAAGTGLLTDDLGEGL